MRTKLLAALACAGFIASASAGAQGLSLSIDTVDPLTKLPADQWIQLVVRVVNAGPIVGKDSVYMINATGEDLSAVMCSKWALVGSEPYITNNKTTSAAKMLPKWSVTLVPTEGFDGYCKNGVEAAGAISRYNGTLNATDKSFTGSTFVVFQKAR